MAEIISTTCVSHLPFIEEAVSEWSSEGDLATFLIDLCDQPCVMIAPDGSRHESNYSDYGVYLFDGGVTEMQQLAEELSDASTEVYHQDPAKRETTPRDFLHDLKFGRAAKALIAWKAVDSAVLSESAFVSIYHTLEAGSDLDCSVQLVKQHYYKQAGYCLRAFIENITLPLWFVAEPEAFAAWNKDDFRVPRFRGKDGLVRKLVTQHLITDELSKQTDSLYQRLNAYVHSTAGTMIHGGHVSGEWRGLSFKHDAFDEWCDLVAACVEAAIQMVKTQVDAWLTREGADPNLCVICHSISDYSVEENTFAGRTTYMLRCNRCGHIWHRSSC